MCGPCRSVRKLGIIETPNFRTPSEFPGPEKRDGEVPRDIISQGVDCFPPPAESPEGKALLDQVAMPSLFSELKEVEK